jgi:hypothetical protein
VQENQVIERAPFGKWVVLVIGSIFLWMLLPWLGVDHMATIDRLTPTVLAVVVVLGCGVVTAYALAYFNGLKTGTGIAYWKAAQRRDAFARWVLMGVFTSAFLGLLVAIFGVFLLGPFAAYLPGDDIVFHAAVTKFGTSSGHRRPCKLDLEFQRDGMSESKLVCYDPIVGPSLGPGELKAGDPVDVSARVTALGTAVLAVRRRQTEGS